MARARQVCRDIWGVCRTNIELKDMLRLLVLVLPLLFTPCAGVGGGICDKRLRSGHFSGEHWTKRGTALLLSVA